VAKENPPGVAGQAQEESQLLQPQYRRPRLKYKTIDGRMAESGSDGPDREYWSVEGGPCLSWNCSQATKDDVFIAVIDWCIEHNVTSRQPVSYKAAESLVAAVQDLLEDCIWLRVEDDE
jgi:hypothetical protein